jgi:hypothetical protein
MTPQLSRRDWFRVSAGLGAAAAGWFPAFAAAAAGNSQRKRSCILLWMNGGPSTIDLFDLKPGHANGGPFKQIEAAPGLQIGEHLPKLAKHGKHLAVVRSMSTKEGDHARGTYYLRTGNLPTGAIQFPTIGSLVSKELGDSSSELPNFVSVAPFRQFAQGAFGPGFLGPNYAPLIVGENNNFGPPMPGEAADRSLRVQDLDRPRDITAAQAESRYDLLKDLENGFGSDRPDLVAQSHATAYDRAVRLMQSVGAKAFDLSEEPTKTRDAYGRTLFGQGCLLARRLVERGVPFVEVNLSGWDTHQNNFDALPRLCGALDSGWASLMADLSSRGLLETTTIIWMGEFGRTPRINNGRGRDHFPNAWSAVLAGGGIKGGQAVGKTTDDGTKVDGPPTSVPDLLATLCKALGIDHTKTNNSNVGRPIRIVDKSAKVLKDAIA